MMENPRPKQKKKKINGIRTLFKLKKETKVTKDRILRDIKNLLEHEKEEDNYYKPVRVIDFWSNKYIQTNI